MTKAATLLSYERDERRSVKDDITESWRIVRLHVSAQIEEAKGVAEKALAKRKAASSSDESEETP